MQITPILAALGLITPAAQAVPTEIRNTARILAATCETAIRSGDWVVDGACDPDAAMDALNRALLGLDEDQIADASKRMASYALNAIASGDWSVDGDALDTIMSARATLNAANDTHRNQMIAA